MAKKKKETPQSEYITIKVRRKTVDRVKKEKENKYMPLGTFYDEAAEEKLVKEKNNSSPYP